MLTRRELGAAFAAAGDLFAIEFGLVRGSAGGTAVVCELLDTTAGMHNIIRVTNTGPVAALDRPKSIDNVHFLVGEANQG